METADSAQIRTATESQSPISAEPRAPVSAAQEGACPMCHGSGSSRQSWLAKRRGWVLLGSAAAAGTGLALGEEWMTFTGLAPLLYFLPCAAIIVFCMRGMTREAQTTPDQSPVPVPPASDGNTQE